MPTAEQFTRACAGQMGYQEDPAGSNLTKYALIADHPNGYPWCATFLVAMAETTDLDVPGGVAHSAYTWTQLGAWRNLGLSSLHPQVGAWAYFEIGAGHVGVAQAPPQRERLVAQPARGRVVFGVAARRARPPADLVVEAIASPLLDPTKSLRLIETSTTVAKWLDAGADLELDVIPTVSRLMARRAEPVRTWAYFTAAVREAAAQRLAPVEPIQPAEAFDGQRSQPYARAAGGRPRSVLAAMASDLSRFSGK